MNENFYMILAICLSSLLFLIFTALMWKLCAKKIQSIFIRKFRTNRTPAPIQLKNLGNTCYFNTALQVLYQTPVLGWVLKNQVKVTKECTLTKNMRKFYSAHASFVPEKLLEIIQIKSGKFESNRQGDSYELLRFLLNGLIDEEQKNKKIGKSKIESLFKGHIISSFLCSKCCQGDHLVEKYLDLSIPIYFRSTSDDDECNKILESIESKGTTCDYSNALLRKFSNLAYEVGNDIKVEDCLSYFTHTNLLSLYLCQHCYQEDPLMVDEGRIPQAVTRTQIIDLPPVLIIHLKRFEMLPNGSFQKCNRHVAYKEILDLSDFCFDVPSKFSPSLSKNCFNIPPSNCDLDSEKFDSNGNDKNIIDGHVYNRGTTVKIPYKLYGIVVHAGTLDCGHYVAYVKQRKKLINDLVVENNFDRKIVTKDWVVDALKSTKSDGDVIVQIENPEISNDEDDCWFYVSDSTIHEVSKERALNQQAYLLFYERLSQAS